MKEHERRKPEEVTGALAGRRLFEPEERATLEAIRDNPPPPKPGQAHPSYTRLVAGTVARNPRRIVRSPEASSNELHTAVAASDVGGIPSADRPPCTDERRRGDGQYAEDAMEAIDPERFDEMTGPTGRVWHPGAAEAAINAALSAIEAWERARRAERDIVRTSFAQVSEAWINSDRMLDEAVRLYRAWNGGVA